MPILAALGSIAAFIAAQFSAIFAFAIGWIATRIAIKILMLGVAGAIFTGVFFVAYGQVRDFIDSAITAGQNALTGSSVLSDGMGTFLCMMPPTLPDALSGFLNIMVLALVVRVTRQIAFSKAT